MNNMTITNSIITASKLDLFCVLENLQCCLICLSSRMHRHTSTQEVAEMMALTFVAALRELKLANDSNHPFPWPTLSPPYTFYPPFSLPGSVLEPEPQSPIDRCLCVVRCCKTTMRMRRAVTLTRSMPLVRRRRCCGCQDCGSL